MINTGTFFPAAILFERIFGLSDKITPSQAAIFAMLTLVIVLRGWRVSAKYRRKYGKKYVYKHRVFTDPRSRVGARQDDLDLPSGFGGPSGYHAIKREDPDEADAFPQNINGR